MNLIELICAAKDRSAYELESRGIDNYLIRNSLRDDLVECGLSCDECDREEAWSALIILVLAQVSGRTR